MFMCCAENTERTRQASELIGKKALIHTGETVQIVGCNIDMRPDEVLVKDSDGSRYWYDIDRLRFCLS